MTCAEIAPVIYQSVEMSQWRGLGAETGMGVGLTLVCLAGAACIMQTHSLIVMAPLPVISPPLFDSAIVLNCIITARATAFILEPFFC